GLRLCVTDGPSDAGGARQRNPGAGGGEARVDIAIARADQVGLRVDGLDVPGYTRLETLARLREFVLGEPQALGRDRLLGLRRAQVQIPRIHVRGDLVA